MKGKREKRKFPGAKREKGTTFIPQTIAPSNKGFLPVLFSITENIRALEATDLAIPMDIPMAIPIS